MPATGARPDRHGKPSGKPPGLGGGRVAKQFGKPQGEPPGASQGRPPPGAAGGRSGRLARRPLGRRGGGQSDRLPGQPSATREDEQGGKYSAKYSGKYDGMADGKYDGMAGVQYGGKRSGNQNGEREVRGDVEPRAVLAAVAHGWRQRGARSALGAGLLALWSLGYFGVAYSPLVLRARLEVLPWDRAIPFTGWAVWIYLAGLPMIAAPLLLLRAGRPLRRLVLGYLVVIVVAVACFAVFPVASSQLRVAAGGAGLDPLTALALATLRALDPPFNSFPSLHVALGALAAWSMGDAAPGTRAGWNLALALVAWSVCAIKQHTVLDVAGGLALALAVRAWLGAGAARAYRLPPRPNRRARQRPLGGREANRRQSLPAAASLNWRQALARYAMASLNERPSLSRRVNEREGGGEGARQSLRGADAKAFQSPSRVSDRDGRQRLPAVANLNLRQALARYARSEPGRRLLSPGATGSRYPARHTAHLKQSGPTPPVSGRGVWLLRDANSNLRLPGFARWNWRNWRRASPRAARSHPGLQQPAPPRARASWKMLPLAVVFALFVVYYAGAA